MNRLLRRSRLGVAVLFWGMVVLVWGHNLPVPLKWCYGRPVMAILPIVLYPDPVLLKPTRPVSEIDDRLRQLVADMVETMNAAPGIGLAANQVGVSKRVCIVDLSAGQEEGMLHVFINPELLEVNGRDVDEEGCLSFPDITFDVERPAEVVVRAQNLEGETFELKADGLFGRAIQHECEHLNGHVFIRNLSSLKRDLIKKRIKKRIKAGDWTATPES